MPASPPVVQTHEAGGGDEAEEAHRRGAGDAKGVGDALGEVDERAGGQVMEVVTGLVDHRPFEDVEGFGLVGVDVQRRGDPRGLRDQGQVERSTGVLARDQPLEQRSHGPGGLTRPYDNAGRRTQSEETRQRILQAGRELMIERGYRATTVAEIARRAAVHVDTVYELAGRKPVLLRELIEQALSGTDGTVVAEERESSRRCRPNPIRPASWRSTPAPCARSRLAWRPFSLPS